MAARSQILFLDPSIDKDGKIYDKEGLLDNIKNNEQISPTLRNILGKILMKPNVLNQPERVANLIIRDIRANQIEFPIEKAVYGVLADMPPIVNFMNEHKSEDVEKLIMKAFIDEVPSLKDFYDAEEDVMLRF